jgi:hypothetical protein
MIPAGSFAHSSFLLIVILEQFPHLCTCPVLPDPLSVTSHGPIGLKRHNELKELFKGSKAGLVFVTAFLTRKAMTKYLAEIAWETEVWLAEAPSHIIHFNGERFLGPYE